MDHGNKIFEKECGRAEGAGDSGPRLIAWELTSACNLKCVHCRACASEKRAEGELNGSEWRAFLDDVAKIKTRPVLILSGGEPLIHPEFFEILEYARAAGVRAVLATNGTLLCEKTAARIASLGIGTASVSLDGHSPDLHDGFRRIEGAFNASMRGINFLKSAGISVQINVTVTRRNFRDLDEMTGLALSIGARAMHIFLLVPAGRAENMKGDEISTRDYESVLNWFYDKKREYAGRLELKATCAPHYYRVMRERAAAEGLEVNAENFGRDAAARGCMAGCGFAFVSSTGIVQGCGYLPLPAGDIKLLPFTRIYAESELFKKLRDFSNLEGGCGCCEYRSVCGGCRARAFARDGNCFSGEPYCGYKAMPGY